MRETKHRQRIKRFKNGRLLIVLLAIIFISACDQPPPEQGPQFGTKPPEVEVPVYNLAIHPLHNPAKLIKAYKPLIDYLNDHLTNAHMAVEASRDYANFEAKYQTRTPEFILPNPWQTLQAMKLGYQVIAMAGDPNDFKGTFIVRKDSSLQKPTDLRGKAVSYPSHTALAACIMPQYFLHNHGINVNKDIENRYVGSQESAIMNAFLGQTAVAATWPPPWRAFKKEHPHEAAELMVLWETDPLVNNSVMARNDIPAHVVQQVRTLLTGLETTSAGRSILAGMQTARFFSATNDDYDIVRRYITRFEQEVRLVEKP